MKNHRMKRVFTAFLALVLVLTLCPVAPKAQAETAAETCPCCGVAVSEINWIEKERYWDGDDGGHYRLTGNVYSFDEALSYDTTIDFNGYQLGATNYYDCFTLECTLNLMDLSGAGNGRFCGYICVGFDLPGELNLYSGIVAGYSDNTPVCVRENGTVNVYGGTISGGESYGNGGNIYNEGTVNVYGGTISGGESYDNGGNIYNEGAVNVYGGTISGGYTDSCGGNIYNEGTVNVYGGTISGGETYYDGGNIYNAGTTTISDGTITGGQAITSGGNIYNEGTLKITGGMVAGGTANSGANIENGGDLTITGGTITDGNAWDEGGNIWNFGNLTITGGTISGGHADCFAGNIYNSDYGHGRVIVAGGTITAEDGDSEDVYFGGDVLIYAGRYNGSVDLTAYIADCSCYTTDAEGYTVVNAGYEDGSCTNCAYADLVKAGLVEHVPGSHNYEPYGEYDKKCSICGKIVVTPACPCCNQVITTIDWIQCDGIEYVDFSQSGHYKLTGNVTLAGEQTITAHVTLDLNGYTLQACSGSRAFTVAEGGTLTITSSSSGSLVGNYTGENGGTIYVEAGGTLVLYSGHLVGTTVTQYGGTIYNNGTVKLYGGTVEGGTALKGGNICNNAGELLIAGCTVTGGKAPGDGGNGGNIYNVAQMTITGGTVENGTSGEHGGNIYNASASFTYIYGGTISGGTILKGDDNVFGHGGNIYNTGKNNQFHMYGGTISGGQNLSKGRGGNIVFNTGAQGHIYGGTIKNGAAGKGDNIAVMGSSSSGQFSALYILGGTFIAAEAGDFEKSKDHIIKIYSCRYNGTTDILPWMADCCCYEKTDTGYTIWNKGYGSCTDCPYDSAREAGLVEVISGVHRYENVGDKTYVCTICGERDHLDNVQAAMGGVLFAYLEDALYAANEGDVVQMCMDVTLSDIFLDGVTLDLNGYTLTADVITGVYGDIIDTSPRNTGKVICSDMSVGEYNSNLPVDHEGSCRFCPLDFVQWVEPVDENTTKVKFYFAQRSGDTILDDVIKSGNTQVEVQICLTWTSAEGDPMEKTVVFGQELLEKYADKWNGRVFVATISGVSEIADLKATYQVYSNAAYVTMSADTIKTPKYIHNKLSWDKINAYPTKTQDMTVEEMRQLCVDFMEFTKTYLWTPDRDISFIKNASGTTDAMSQGQTYGGLPYVGVASGNPYRMMDYINAYGIVDMQKALPMLGTKDQLTMADLKYFGSQCSESVYWAWGRVMNSAKYMWTSSAVPANNFVLLGDILMEDVDKWTADYNTKRVCQENGTETMFAAYAQLQKADGMVNYIEARDGDGAGHLVMAYSDPEVAYNDDGTINGDESYVYIIDQAQTWEEVTNEQGDTYLRKTSVAAKKTFTQLYSSGYIPFTFQEFLGIDPIEITEVSLVGSTGTLVSGTVSEEDRSFQATATTDNLTWSQLFNASITSNYGIVDAYVIVYDAYGKEIYKHAVRTATAGNKNLSVAETGAMVTTWGEKPAEGTYTAKIEVQLATGERPIIYTGKLAV